MILESNKRLYFPRFTVLLIMLFVFIRPVYAYGYQAVMADMAELISESDSPKLEEAMIELTAYGDVLFYSCHSGDGVTAKSAERAVRSIMGSSSGASVFYIDMDERVLTVYVTGHMADTISKGKCETIADNVYKLASKGDYVGAAIKAYNQMLNVCKGIKIDNGMQTASNICLALLLSILINYGLVKLLHGNRKKKTLKQLNETGSYVWFTGVDTEFRDSTRKYSPRSKGSSRGGHGGGFGGGFGGGGFGGGGHGGSHSF